MFFFTFQGNRREFLVRWVGHTAEDDSWEPEENLDCPDLIDKFLAQQEKLSDLGTKRLREAPTKVKRLEYASSKREGKRHGGFRVSYVDMDV